MLCGFVIIHYDNFMTAVFCNEFIYQEEFFEQINSHEKSEFRNSASAQCFMGLRLIRRIGSLKVLPSCVDRNHASLRLATVETVTQMSAVKNVG